MQIIPQPLPCINLPGIQPRLPIRQRQEKPPPANHHAHNRRRSGPEREERVRTHSFPSTDISLRCALCFCAVGVFFGGVVGGGRRGGVRGNIDGIEVEDEFEEGTGDEGGGEVGGEVVVQEELAAHEVEGEVVRCPAEEEESRGVVEAGAGTYSSLIANSQRYPGSS